MLVALGFCEKDWKSALEWIGWVEELGACTKHECLLVADAGMHWGYVLQLLTRANQVFKKASVITTDKPYAGWPKACNKMFFAAAKWAQNHQKPWLWMEPDAIPLRRHWLDQIENNYGAAGAPFMGAFVDGVMFGQQKRYMNGVAVYPGNAYTIMKHLEDSELAFDVACAEMMIGTGVNSELFHCHWGYKDKAPMFVPARADSDPENHVTLDFIRPQAVLFHRNKDGTLIQLLRERIFPRIVVMLPFCWRDAQLMYQNLQHMERMHGQKKAAAVLHFDNTAPQQTLGPLMTQARRVFSECYASRYQEPKVVGWPWAPNTSFAMAARYMQTHLRRPWLWLEADAVPMRKDWYELICMEYAAAGKEFMGCHIQGIVPHTGHYNGVAVYPPDAATILQKGMRATSLAFDTEMASEMVHRAHNSRLIQHNRGQPGFHTIGDVQAHVWPETVLYHPCKGGDLFRLL